MQCSDYLKDIQAKYSPAVRARMTGEAGLAIDTKRKYGFSHPPRTLEAPFEMARPRIVTARVRVENVMQSYGSWKIDPQGLQE